MAIGNPIIKCRVSRTLLAEIREDIDKLNSHYAVSQLSLSDWMIAAFRERLAKRKRSRDKRKPRDHSDEPLQTW